MDLALNLANVGILALILVGVALHHRRATHVRLMFLAFLLDLGLLLTVEFSGDSAVGRAFRSVTSGDAPDRLIVWVHVAFAASALVLWFVQIAQGVKLLKGDESVRARHLALGKLFLLLRLGNVVTAWMV